MGSKFRNNDKVVDCWHPSNILYRFFKFLFRFLMFGGLLFIVVSYLFNLFQQTTTVMNRLRVSTELLQVVIGPGRVESQRSNSL